MHTPERKFETTDITRRSEEVSVPCYMSDSKVFKDAKISVNGEVYYGESDFQSDFTGDFATAGLVDLQINGFAGVDFNLPEITSEMIDHALAEMTLTGVTKCLPTLITGSDSHLINTLSALDSAIFNSRLGPLMVEGYHIEGPFLSPLDGYSGAHDPKYMSEARIELIDRLQDAVKAPIRMVTVAPEVGGATEFISELVSRDICVSIGHSASNFDQIEAAVDAGASLSTHLGNGLPQRLHKTENPIFWHLAHDELTAMFIADGIHIPKPALKAMLRAKGLTQSILTTDAVSAAGRNMTPGRYTLGQIEVELSSDMSVRQPGADNLAGSSVTMDQMVRNLLSWYNIGIPEVLQLTERNPRRTLKLDSPQNSTDGCVEIVEWTQSSAGPCVSKAHIGPFTINNQSEEKKNEV